MATPVRENLKIYKGSRYEHTLNVQEDGVAWPMSGYTARMHFRTDYDTTTTLFEATTSDYLSIGTYSVKIDIPGSVSTLWSFEEAVYDLEIVDGSDNVYRLIQGTVRAMPEVTR